MKGGGRIPPPYQKNSRVKLSKKLFVTINFLDQKKNGRLLTVPEILMKGGGRIPPPTQNELIGNRKVKTLKKYVFVEVSD